MKTDDVKIVELNIPQEFGTKTGFRTYSDGPKSGQEFYDTLLKDRFQMAVDSHSKLCIYFDGGEGYTSSFINESFRRLAIDFNPDLVWKKLILVANEYPRMRRKVNAAIYGN